MTNCRPATGGCPTAACWRRIEELYDNEYGGDNRPPPADIPLPSSIEEFLQGLEINLADGDSSGGGSGNDGGGSSSDGGNDRDRDDDSPDDRDLTPV